jgi:hypothetical protein
VIIVHLETLSQTIYNFTTSGAVVIGGIWAYFKFIRGRTFSHRAELAVTPAIQRCNGWKYLHVTMALKNTGLSKLPISDDMKYIQLYGMANDGDDSASTVEWKWLLTKRVFDQHAWVEAQETVTDTVVFRLQDARAQAHDDSVYQVEVWLGAPRSRITRKGSLWHARTVIFSSADSPNGRAMLAGNGKTLIERILNRR